VKLSVIVLVYNEEQTIGEIVTRILAADVGDIEKEIIIANDGSSDGTLRAIDASAWRGDLRVQVHQNSTNLGKGAAIRLGLRREYHPRRVDEGKNIRWVDGLDALYLLITCRLMR